MNNIIYNKETVCPLCKNKFKYPKVIKSRLVAVTKDSDFYTKYEGVEPILYDILICDNCGYANFEKEFSSLNPNLIDILNKNVVSKWNKKDLNSERTPTQAIGIYKIAYYEAGLMREKSSLKAKILHRITWLYRILGDKENENEYIGYTLEAYKHAFNSEDIENSSSIAYIIGELYRRIDNKKEAVKWFSMVINSPDKSSNPYIVNMARTMWQECLDHQS